MSLYPYDPRRSPSPYPEFNIGGDVGTGTTGSGTSSSVLNAEAQKPPAKASDNPFTAMLDHVSAFNSAAPRQSMNPGVVPLNPGPNPPSWNAPPNAPSWGSPVSTMPVPTAPPPTSSTQAAPGKADLVNLAVPSSPTLSFSTQSVGLPGGGPGGGPLEQLPPESPAGGGGGIIPPPGTPPETTTPGGGTRGRPAAPVTPQNDWLHNDPTGKPWGPDNMPPKPPGTENQDVAAKWYSQFNYLDPTLVNVTGTDVGNYRTSGYQGDFLAWWKAGKPMPAQAPPTTPLTNTWTPAQAAPPPPDPSLIAREAAQKEKIAFEQAGGQYPGLGTPPAPPGTREEMGQQKIATEQAPPPVAAGGPPAAVAPPIHTPSTPFTNNPTPIPGAETGTPANIDEITRLIDLFTQGQNGGAQPPGIESLLNPMFKRQRQNTIGDLRAAASTTPGRLQSGGFEANQGEAVSNLAAQQSGQLAEAMSAEYLAKLNQETKYKELATTAGMQKYVADINADLARFGITTNNDLQRWLSSEDNALKRYGIDANDVLQRYQANLQLEGTKYSADAGVSAASLHAAASQAAAAASSSSAAYSANKQFELGMAKLGVDRESNIGQFILGIMGLGITNLNDLNGILAGIPTGSIVVKP